MDQKVIVLTGVTKGLGNALALRYMQDGHTVLGCGRSPEAIASLNEYVAQSDSTKSKSKFWTVDVTSRTEVDEWALNCVEGFGSPDFLINNAAIIHDNIPFWQISAYDFDRVIDINIKGIANVTRAFMPSLLEEGQGTIVNLSSGYGQFTAPGVSAYCTSKFAVEGFSKALANDVPNGIAVIPMSPGVINTDMLKQTFGAENAENCEPPESWVNTAAPYILNLGMGQHGESVRVPQ